MDCVLAYMENVPGGGKELAKYNKQNSREDNRNIHKRNLIENTTKLTHVE